MFNGAGSARVVYGVAFYNHLGTCLKGTLRIGEICGRVIG